MFEKRVIIGKKYCVTASSACLITANINGVVVTLIDEVQPGQYYFYAPTSSINSSIDPSYILEVAKSGGASTTVRSGQSCNCEPYELTAEAIQEVVPIAWGSLSVQAKTDNTSLAIAVGNGAYTAAEGVALGYKAKASKWNGAAIGFTAEVNGERSIALTGRGGKALKPAAITIGSALNDTSGEYTCITEGTGSITIGVAANTLNTTSSNGTVTESSNSVTIGCKASNSGADSVVIGAQAKNSGNANVFIGVNAYFDRAGDEQITIVGTRAHSYNNGTAIGYAARGGSFGTAVGSGAYSGTNAIAIGTYADATDNGTAISYNAKAKKADSIAVGRRAVVDAVNSIAIGSSATVDNTTDADGTITPSENTTVVGYGASASAPNAVVLGAGASNLGADSVVIGAGTSNKTINNFSPSRSITIGAGAIGGYASVTIGSGTAKTSAPLSVAIGDSATSIGLHGISVGAWASSEENGVSIGAYCNTALNACAIGYHARGYAENSVAIGQKAAVSDYGATVIRSTASDDNIYTQLYFSGANTPLANTYEDGEAMMGYVVMQKGSDGQFAPVAAGTQKLSVLFPNNSTFQPATIDENGEWVMPKVFHPSDLNLPVEEPTEEPEDVEINIPEPILPEPTEPEPYTPLPVYPIVEPELEEIEKI